MKKIFIFAAILISADIIISGASEMTFFSTQSGRRVRVVKDEVLVKFKERYKERAALHKSMGVNKVKENKKLGFEKVKIPSGKTIKEVIKNYTDSGAVEYAEPNYIYNAFKTPDDTDYPKQWGLEKIDAPEGWDITTGGGAVIAVIDSGIAYNHPDLAANIWANTGEVSSSSGTDSDGNGYIDDTRGWDFHDDDNDPSPDNTDENHGTHVAGIAGAVSNNSTGTAGVSWSDKLMAVKCFYDEDGDLPVAEIADIAEGIKYAADNGADIINMSFGASSGSQALENAVNSAYSKGVFLVAASGNDNKLVYYPAAYDNVMAVGATNENDVRESYSNYGTQLDVMAPGSGIYSTLRSDNYGEMSGTSMACPFVAGEAALIISYWEENNIYYRPVDIKNIIIYGCDDIGSYGRDNMTGHGRINIGTSLTQAKDGVVRIDEEKSIVYPNPFNPETTNALFIMPADTSEDIQELNI
jgi:subtilisin family serine protease